MLFFWTFLSAVLMSFSAHAYQGVDYTITGDEAVKIYDDLKNDERSFVSGPELVFVEMHSGQVGETRIRIRTQIACRIGRKICHISGYHITGRPFERDGARWNEQDYEDSEI